MKIAPPHSGWHINADHSKSAQRFWGNLSTHALGADSAKHIHASRNVVASPVERAILNAFRAAALPVNEHVMSRLLQTTQVVLQRNPQINIPRLSRLLLELELRGQTPSAPALDAFLSTDAFGIANILGQAGQDSKQQEDKKHPNHPVFEQNPSTSEPAITEDIFDSLSLEVIDSQGKELSPSWHWLSLGAEDWCKGGSFRWAYGKQGMRVNVDVVVEEGIWQFHWAEPERKRLIVSSPLAKKVKSGPEPWFIELEKFIGPLGFVEFRTLAPDDWFDGFNFLASERILRQIDMVV